MSDMIRYFFHTLPFAIYRSFAGRNLMWHALAIVITVVCVASGFDWLYFKTTRPIAFYLFPAVILGWRMPVVFPVAAYIVGAFRRDPRLKLSAYATAQAALIGLLISASYKAITGRPGLRYARLNLIDNSREFHFGFLKGGVFWGWPSSHTTVACAMSAALWTLYPKSRVVRGSALIYALYIGVGVSMTIHWFSDFAAGSILGAVIGMTVGKHFGERLGSDGR